MSKPRLIVIGPLPPPIHGVAVSTSLVLENKELRKSFEVEHLDTSDHRAYGNIGKWEIGNVVLGLRNTVQLIGWHRLSPSLSGVSIHAGLLVHSCTALSRMAGCGSPSRERVPGLLRQIKSRPTAVDPHHSTARCVCRRNGRIVAWSFQRPGAIRKNRCGPKRNAGSESGSERNFYRAGHGSLPQQSATPQGCRRGC